MRQRQTAQIYNRYNVGGDGGGGGEEEEEEEGSQGTRWTYST